MSDRAPNPFITITWFGPFIAPAIPQNPEIGAPRRAASRFWRTTSKFRRAAIAALAALSPVDNGPSAQPLRCQPWATTGSAHGSKCRPWTASHRIIRWLACCGHHRRGPGVGDQEAELPATSATSIMRSIARSSSSSGR